MTINIKDEIFTLPKIRDCKEYFPEYVNTYLKKYINFLSENKVKNKIIDTINEYTKDIYACLIEYYCGQHNSSIYFLKKAINYINLADICHIIDEDVFYRARKPNDTKTKLSNSQMFHVPFEKRYLVSTQRYSYPGLPCLYLSSSYKMCCDELKNWDNKLNIALIEKNRFKKISVLDLYFFEKFNFEILTTEEFEKFVLTWPLIACCSFAYENTENMQFRPDYIIPQLLLEYIIDINADNAINGINDQVYGIKYHSVLKPFFDNSKVNISNTHINYVFPSLSNQLHGHCSILQNFFEVKHVFFLEELNDKEHQKNGSTSK